MSHRQQIILEYAVITGCALITAVVIFFTFHAHAEITDRMPDVLVGHWKENVVGKFPDGLNIIDELYART